MTFPFPFFPLASATGLISLARVAQATSSGNGSTSITMPAGINAGDLLIFAGWAGDSNNAPGASLAGWSALISSTSASFSAFGRAIVAAKVAAGTESGSSFNGFSGTQDQFNSRIVVVLRGNKPVATVGTGQGVNGQFTGGTISNQTIAASGGTPPLLAVAQYLGSGGDNLSAARTFTVGGSPAADDTYNETTRHYLSWKFYPSSPADVVAGLGSSAFGRWLASAYAPLT